MPGTKDAQVSGAEAYSMYVAATRTRRTTVPGILTGHIYGGVPERSKGSDCKSDGSAFEGSNPSPSTISHEAK